MTNQNVLVIQQDDDTTSKHNHKNLFFLFIDCICHWFIQLLDQYSSPIHIDLLSPMSYEKQPQISWWHKPFLQNELSFEYHWQWTLLSVMCLGCFSLSLSFDIVIRSWNTAFHEVTFLPRFSLLIYQHTLSFAFVRFLPFESKWKRAQAWSVCSPLIYEQIILRCLFSSYQSDESSRLSTNINL